VVSPRWGLAGVGIAYRAFPRPAMLENPSEVKIVLSC